MLLPDDSDSRTSSALSPFALGSSSLVVSSSSPREKSSFVPEPDSSGRAAESILITGISALALAVASGSTTARIPGIGPISIALAALRQPSSNPYIGRPANFISLSAQVCSGRWIWFPVSRQRPAGLKQARPRTFCCQFVPWIAQWTHTNGKAAAADAAIQLIAQPREARNTPVKLRTPARRQLFPILCRGSAPVWQCGQCLSNSGQRNPRTLRNLDDSNPTKYLARIPALVAAIAPAVDQSPRFVKVQRGHRHATALGHFPDGEDRGDGRLIRHPNTP